MNRKQRRIAQAQEARKPIIAIDGKIYTADEANTLAWKEYHGGNAENALHLYSLILKRFPDYAPGWRNQAVIFRAMKRHDDALANYNRALRLPQDHAAVHYNRGNIFHELKRLAEALEDYDKAIALAPDFAEVYNNRGLVLQELQRPEEALLSYERMIALRPDHAVAHYNRGIVLQKLKRYEDALASHERALHIHPGFAEAHEERGNALREMERFEEALESYGKAVSLNPKSANMHVNRGNTLQKMNRREEALAEYDQALRLNPNCLSAIHNRGGVLQSLGRQEEALACFDKALSLGPDLPYALGALLHAKMQLCDWRGTESLLERLIRELEEEKPAASPFSAIASPLPIFYQKKCAEIYARDKFPSSETPCPAYTHDKIRLGYFSADFYDHATAHLLAEVIERHDRSRFEVTAFSFGPTKKDAMRARMEKAFDRFMDVGAMTDAEIAALARKTEIDIAIDLKGFTQDSRTGIFARRAAPVQVNYLGFPGTMGAAYMDYILADRIIIPEVHKPFYAEKIAYLPHSYQPNDSHRKISHRAFTRREMNLPEDGFVFACFNSGYKITPDVFDIWMRLLREVEGSVLWLLGGNPAVEKNLRAEAAARGISGNRLVFAGRAELSEHLARHRLADLFLDTFHCNAHTTASDALWAGLPVLTLLGETFASRVAASLLNAVGLAELVAASEAEYEARARELALNPQARAEITRKLKKNRDTSPLFNAALITSHLESAYAQMHARAGAGLAPCDMTAEA